ncbi:TRAP transporter small permease [Billgrantia aerodenitrificans]|uniref:TRAP transporter small permease protein n=1 Tax=Billgrantia aerodenitrificans TaxID=2733483 RepID=A0ABS9AY90_9GAMM|nr:TRAP transporter small permease subunit [Halomonas aerodenitrificans]MCE8026672.1 TRAP transporter small permease subunit [Halomonas aerodenitrificans]
MTLLLIAERISRLMNRIGAIVAILLILYMLGHILLEIFLRMFGGSTFIMDEYIGYAVAVMTFMGLPYVLEKGGLIRVSLLLERIPEKHHWPLEFFSSAITAACFIWMSLFWFRNVQRSYTRGIISDTLAETPIWIPEGAVLLGMWLIALTLVLRALKVLAYRQEYLVKKQ